MNENQLGYFKSVRTGLALGIAGWVGIAIANLIPLFSVNQPVMVDALRPIDVTAVVIGGIGWVLTIVGNVFCLNVPHGLESFRVAKRALVLTAVGAATLLVLVGISSLTYPSATLGQFLAFVFGVATMALFLSSIYWFQQFLGLFLVEHNHPGWLVVARDIRYTHIAVIVYAVAAFAGIALGNAIASPGLITVGGIVAALALLVGITFEVAALINTHRFVGTLELPVSGTYSPQH